jgi:hypothetical protein
VFNCNIPILSAHWWVGPFGFSKALFYALGGPFEEMDHQPQRLKTWAEPWCGWCQNNT